MSERLDVYLYGRRIAEIERKTQQNYRLQYLDDWARSPGAMPISFSLPLPQRVYGGQVLSNFLDNLLPDSDDVRNRWAREAGLETAESSTCSGNMALM